MHSETSIFKKRVINTYEDISFLLKKFKKPYIAYSGGKDSCVLLHFLMKIDPNTAVIHWDYGPYLIPRMIEARIIQNALNMGARYLRLLTSHSYNKLKRNVNNVWGKEFMERVLPSLVKEGFDCSFIGLRAEESHKRKARTLKMISKDKVMLNIYPLKDWTWKDIYAYLLINKIPYLNEHYDKYGVILGYDRARFVTFFDPDFKHLGSENIDGILQWDFKNL